MGFAWRRSYVREGFFRDDCVRRRETRDHHHGDDEREDKKAEWGGETSLSEATRLDAR